MRLPTACSPPTVLSLTTLPSASVMAALPVAPTATAPAAIKVLLDTSAAGGQVRAGDRSGGRVLQEGKEERRTGGFTGRPSARGGLGTNGGSTQNRQHAVCKAAVLLHASTNQPVGQPINQAAKHPSPEPSRRSDTSRLVWAAKKAVAFTALSLTLQLLRLITYWVLPASGAAVARSTWGGGGGGAALM